MDQTIIFYKDNRKVAEITQAEFMRFNFETSGDFLLLQQNLNRTLTGVSNLITAPSKEEIEKERRKLTDSMRYKIMRKDSFHCVLCGATGKDDNLVIDHIYPVALGGKTKQENLRTLCRTCNSGKGTEIDIEKLTFLQ